MAFSRAMSCCYWRNMVNSTGKNRSFVSSTTPKMKEAYAAPTHGYPPPQNQVTKPRRRVGWVNGQLVPVYVALGLIVCSLTLGAYTAEHQLRYNPSIRLKKKKRETMPEVVDPDGVMEEADGFINKSWFRKIAHVQEFQNPVVPDGIRGDVFSKPSTAESLESVGVGVGVGVDPSDH